MDDFLEKREQKREMGTAEEIGNRRGKMREPEVAEGVSKTEDWAKGFNKNIC